MSMSVDSLGQGSMISQLQKMQQQMRTLSVAAGVPDFKEQLEQSKQALQQDVVSLNNTNNVNDDNANVDNIGAFANMLHQAFENVNNLQNDASTKQSRFDVGDRSVTLSDVMLASQKASISFDATIQVRNKMIEAYRTISQMQI